MRQRQKLYCAIVVSLVVVILSGLTFPGRARAADATAGGTTAPFRHGGSVASFFPGVTYDPKIPTPASVLGFELGSRPVRYEEVVRYFRALDDASPRAELHAFAETYEGRALYYLIVGSDDNVKNAETIRTGIAKLADPPSSGVVAGADQIISASPAIAWMGYSIHGDELSGVDAALWTAYHLVAATDAATQKIRDHVLTLIDPTQNPDGRERFLSQIYMLSGQVASADAQSLQHGGFWPWGRGNHYLFDMNRDWLPMVHAETRGRVAVILHWNPQLVVDAHEMGSYSSYLFSPPREPVNPNVTPTLRHWWDVFAADQGAAFDRHRWSYTTGDWNEEWFPGYGSSWSLFTGAVGILYEQARVEGSRVKRPDGTVLSFSETVAHQAVSSLSNLATLADHRQELLADFARFHRDAVTGADKNLHGAFILAPGDNEGRAQSFLSAMKRHGLRVERANSAFSSAVQSSHGEKSNRKFPSGSFIIPLNQPMGMMVKSVLEFDPHLSAAFLQEERRELEKGNGTRLYEVSGWSMPLAYDLDIGYTGTRPTVASEPMPDSAAPSAGELQNPDAGFGYLLSPTDDRSMNALARMLETGLQVHATTKPFAHEGAAYPAGTLLLRRSENADSLPQQLKEIARQTGVHIQGTSSGYSSAGPDLGSDDFETLLPPRIGLFMGAGIDFTSCGSLWFLLDHELGMRQSLLDITQLSGYDLSAYNVLVLPSYWGGAGLKEQLGPSGLQKLKDWVKAGGTLIAIGESAFFCADSSSGLSAAREKSAVLESLAQYEQASDDELAAFSATVDTSAIWNPPPAGGKDGKNAGRDTSGKPSVKLDTEELKRRDEQARRFAPQGAILRLDLNPTHWLAFGVTDRIADSSRTHTNAMIYSAHALMAKDPVEVPARFAPASQLRLAGLLWPEGRQRWARAAYATREGMGKGQVILFADDPFFRAYFHGTKRLFLNAVLLGPGLGTRSPAPW